MNLFGKEVKEMPGLTPGILDQFSAVFHSESAEGKSYDMENGDTLYYIKEKPYMVYRLAAVLTKEGYFYQFGIVNPYKLNMEKDTMVGIHENSEYVKSLDIPKEETPKVEPNIPDNIDKAPEEDKGPETKPEEKKLYVVAGVAIPETDDPEKNELLKQYEESTVGKEYLIIENFNVVKLLKMSVNDLGHVLQVLAILVDVEHKDVHQERVFDSTFSFDSVIDFVEVNSRIDSKVKERIEEIKKELSNR